MAQTMLTLWNLALSAIGTRSRVNSETEASLEAEQCRLWYETVRRRVLCAAPWGSCRAVASLPLIAERDFNLAWQEGDPEPPWPFVYGLPVDYIYPRFLDSYASFSLTTYSKKHALLAAVEAPTLVYTRLEETPALWEPDLYEAVAYGLAAAISLKLLGKTSRMMAAMQLANDKIIQARISNANQNVAEDNFLPEWLIARGITTQAPVNRFVYPSGSLLSFTAVT